MKIFLKYFNNAIINVKRYVTFVQYFLSKINYYK